jgi:hypothetical protein
MENNPESRAARVEGEVIVLHCWACGMPHYVNVELFDHERLPNLVCGERSCGKSLFLLDELVFESKVQAWARGIERSTVLGAFSKFLR